MSILLSELLRSAASGSFFLDFPSQRFDVDYYPGRGPVLSFQDWSSSVSDGTVPAFTITIDAARSAPSWGMNDPTGTSNFTSPVLFMKLTYIATDVFRDTSRLCAPVLSASGAHAITGSQGRSLDGTDMGAAPSSAFVAPQGHARSLRPQRARPNMLERIRGKLNPIFNGDKGESHGGDTGKCTRTTVPSLNT